MRGMDLKDSVSRCPWCGSDPLYVAYHDNEWGTPVHDERKHFEFLLLETQQAGLSWRTILGKREAYRRAFANFEPQAVACLGSAEIDGLLQDPGIVRNRRKLEGAVRNAQVFLGIVEEFGSFDAWLWNFVEGRAVRNCWTEMRQVPITTALSDRVSAEMKARGMAYIGSTTIYAHLQAVGVVNDHLAHCFRWSEIEDRA
jgi:DNA-3-methyladenine glycosylase I